jgi:segregation and condensation protein A
MKQEEIYDMLLSQDEISWQKILMSLVKASDMDPWEIDISKIAQRYIEAVKKLKELDLRLSGKVILAAAILLKVKSIRLIEHDMAKLDSIINSFNLQDSVEEEFYDELELEYKLEQERKKIEVHKLIPRTPQPRKRKVSIYDLMDALEQALEVRRRRIINNMPVKDDLLLRPIKKVNIASLMKKVYFAVNNHYINTNNVLTFNELVKDSNKSTKVYTFIPLLHLSNMRKLELEQKELFGDINIHLLSGNAKDINKELGIEN